MPVAIYIRYSSHLQDAGFSVEMQEDACRKWILSQDELKAKPILPPFIDRAQTGRRFEAREKFNDLLKRAGNREFEAVVIYKWDRFGRTLLKSLKAIARLEHMGVKVYSATEGNDETLRNMLLTFSQHYSRDLGEKTRDGLRRCAANGFHTGAQAPYGYQIAKKADPSGRTDKDGNPIMRAVLEVNHEQAPIVKSIFEMYGRQRMGLAAIADALNREGIPSAKGGTWDAGSLRSIFRNQVYSGQLVFGKRRMRENPETETRVPEFQPANEWTYCAAPKLRLVPADLWDAVEELFNKRRAAIGRKDARSAAALRHSHYLLSGVVRCGECAEGYMIAHTRPNPKGRGGRSYHMACSHHRRRGSAVCGNSKLYPMDAIEDTMLDGIESDMFGPDKAELFLAEATRAIEARMKVSGDLDATLRRETADCDKKIARCVEVLADGEQGMGPLKAKLIELQAQRATAQKSLEDLAAAKNPADRKALIARTRQLMEQRSELFRAVRERTIAPQEPVRVKLASFIRDAKLYKDGRLEVEWDVAAVLGESCLEVVAGVGNFSNNVTLRASVVKMELDWQAGEFRRLVE